MRWIFILLFGILLSSVGAQQNTMYLIIDTSQMQIGEAREMTLELVTDQPLPINEDWARTFVDSTAYMGRDTQLIIGSDHFEILDESKWTSKRQQGNKYLSQKMFKYTVWKDGLYFIPPFGITLHTKDSTETLRIPGYHFLTFTPIDTTIQGLAPIRGIEKTSFDFSQIKKKIRRFAFLKFVLALLMLTGIISLFRKSPKRNIERIAIAYTAYLQSKLKELKSGRLESQKEKYSEMSRILRIALEQKYKLPAMEMTTSMIQNKLTKMATSDHYMESLLAIMQRSDEVKYAKATESDEQLTKDITLAEQIALHYVDSEAVIELPAMEVKQIDPQLYEQKRIESYHISTPNVRWMGGLIDTAVLLGLALIIFIPFGYLAYFGYFLEHLSTEDYLMAGGWMLLLYIYYFALGHSWRGRTIGKKVMGSYLVDIDDDRLSVSKALWRVLAKLGSILFLLIGIFWIHRSTYRQAWHDTVVKSFVVHKS